MTWRAGLWAMLTVFLLAACQRGGASATLDASLWLKGQGGTRLEGAMLIRGGFAKVPLLAVISVDDARNLEFVGVSDWGLTLARVCVSQGDSKPAPARLHPLLAHIPGIASRLPQALERIFLLWPEPADARQPDAPEVKYLFDPQTRRITGKKGHDAHGAWTVSLRYPKGAAPDAKPSAIEYTGGGLAIVFKVNDVSGDE